MQRWVGPLVLLTITCPGPIGGSVDGLRWVGLGVLGALGWWRAGGLDRSLWGFGAWALALVIAIPGAGLLYAGLETVCRVLALAGVVMLVRREKDQSWMKWLVGALVLQAIIGIAQRVGFDPLASLWGMPAAIRETGDLRYAVHGTQGHRNLFSSMLVAGAPLAWVKVDWRAGLFLAFVAVATGSQGAVLALMGVAAVVALVRLGGTSRAGAVGLAVLGALLGSIWLAIDGVAGRESIWARSLELIQQHPFRGVGPGGYANAFSAAERAHLYTVGSWDTGGVAAKHAHNELLHAWVTAGLPGAIGLMMAFGWPLILLLRNRERNDEWMCGVAATVAVLCHSMVSFPLTVVSPALIAALGLAVALGPPAHPPKLPRMMALALGGFILVFSVLRWAADTQSASAAEALRSGDFSAAETSALQAVRLFPDAPRAAYHGGIAAWKQGDLKAAEEWLRESIQTNDHHVARRDLGLLLSESDGGAESIGLLSDHLIIHPGASSQPWLVLASLQVERGQSTEAIETLIRCGCSEGSLRAGRLLHAQGQVPDALYRWREVGDDRGWVEIVQHHVAEAEWSQARAALDRIEDEKLRTQWAERIQAGVAVEL